jgi:hypothetical protein
MAQVRITIGNTQAQERFVHANREFLAEYPALSQLLQKTFIRSLAQPVVEEVQRLERLPVSDPAVIAFEDQFLADLAVFYLGRISADDFTELLLLSSNGWGFGALKILRGMYERVVTAAFISKNPAEARAFAGDTPIKKGNIWKRTVQWMPELKERYSVEQIQSIEADYKEALEKRAQTRCNKCGQPITQGAWTRVDLETMAKNTDAGLAVLYASCYLEPTCHSHATSYGIERRLRETGEGHQYRDLSEEEAVHAVLLGHNLILRVLTLQDSHFHLGIAGEIKSRVDAFAQVWGKDKKEEGAL